MGYFLDINNDDNLRAKNTAQITAANGRNGHTIFGAMASQIGPSIFMSVLNKVATSSDGKGGAKDKELSGDDLIASLQKQLDKALSAIGASSVSEIDTVVSKAEETKNANIQKAQDEVDAFSNNSDKYSLEITDLKAQIVTGTDLTDEQKANNTKIKNKIKNLEAKKEDALAKATKNLDKVTVSETKKYEEVVINADKARNLNYQLQDMKAVKEADKSNVQYDAAQEVDDLTSFNKARKAFLSKKNKETAQALKDVYENIDSDSTKRIYEQYLKTEVDKYLK